MRIKRLLMLLAVMGNGQLGQANAFDLEVVNKSNDCDAYSQADMRECLMEKSVRSADELRQAVASVNDAIAKWDEDTKFILTARRQFENSNQAFVRFRDAQCSWSVALGGGAIGNALAIRRLRCVSDLNHARAHELANMAENLPSR
jgi:uncharacterized protein YecT (DUF1311 family)